MHCPDTHSLQELSISDLESLEHLLSSKIGLRFTHNRESQLLRGIRSMAKELGFDDPASCYRWITSSHLSTHLAGILTRHFSVGETYFFRDKNQLNTLEQRILPALVDERRNSGRRIKIWSAGCSTGEEAYTLAIMLDKILPTPSEWNTSVLATDVNGHSLNKARRAEFGNWSFRDCDKTIRDTYFEKTGPARFRLIPRIRNMVEFSYLNLADNTYPSLSNQTNAIDIIVCKNVLMYFDRELLPTIVGNLYKCLNGGGWLIVSAVEMTLNIFNQFEVVRFQEAGFLRKPSARASTSNHESILMDHLRERPSPVDSQSVFGPSSPIHVSDETTMSSPQTTAANARHSQNHALELFKHGRYPEVAQLLEANLADTESTPSQDILTSMELLTRAYANQGDLKQAENICKKLLTQSKTEPRFRYLHAEILLAIGRVGAAKQALRETIYLDSKFTLAHFSLGNIAWKETRKDDAIRHFKNALASLSGMAPDDILADSDGMTVGSITQTIQSFIDQGSRS